MQTPSTPEERRLYLESKFGKALFDVADTDEIPKCAVIPYYAGIEEMLATDQAFRLVEESLERSYQLTLNRSEKGFGYLTRRNFLTAAGVVLASMALPLGGPSVSRAQEVYVESAQEKTLASVSNPESPGVDEHYPTGDPATDIDAFYTDGNGRSLVGMASHGDLGTSVAKAIELAGGLDEILPGQSVCIKPNNVIQMLDFTDLSHKVPTCTNPEVLRHVIRAVVARTENPKTVFVCERAALGSPTLLQMMFSGIYDVALEEGVQILPWENKGYITFTHPKCHYLTQSFKVPESIRHFDHFVNVPVMKNHEMVFDQAEFTAGIKAFVGLLHPNERMTLKHRLHEIDFCEKVVELNLCRPYSSMTVIDATEVVISGGPAYPWMKFASPRIVVAGKDRVATDSVGLAVLKRHAMLVGLDKNYVRKTIWEQRQLRYAAELGLGYAEPQRIDVVHEGVSDAEAILNIWQEI